MLNNLKAQSDAHDHAERAKSEVSRAFKALEELVDQSVEFLWDECRSKGIKVENTQLRLHQLVPVKILGSVIAVSDIKNNARHDAFKLADKNEGIFRTDICQPCILEFNGSSSRLIIRNGDSERRLFDEVVRIDRGEISNEFQEVKLVADEANQPTMTSVIIAAILLAVLLIVAVQ